MNKIILFGVVLSFFACNTNKPIDYPIVKGTIKNINPNDLNLKIFNESDSKTIKLSDTGNFLDTLKNSSPSFYNLEVQKKRFNIYLESGFDLSVKLDSVNAIPIFTGLGSAENNQLLSQDNLKKTLKKYQDYNYLGSLAEEDFLKKMDSVKQAKFNLLDQTAGLSDAFKFIEKQNIVYQWANHLNDYQSDRRYVIKDKTFNVSKNYYNYKKNLTVEDEKLNSVPSYLSFFENYISNLTQDAYKKDSLIDYSQTYLQFVVDSIKSQTLKNVLLYRDAKYSITFVDDFENYYKTFIAASTNLTNNAEIDTIYRALKMVAKGQPSPRFTNYENNLGGTSSLKDLLGHYVYIDVWATWCGPCIAEIPFLKQIEADYHKKNIVFVSISIDTKDAHNTWKKMIKEKRLGGIQLFADNNWQSKFVEDYIIKGIPRFILIDPQGNIISANAPRPSSQELRTLLAKYKL